MSMENRLNQGFTQEQIDFARNFKPGDIVRTTADNITKYGTLLSGRVFTEPGDTWANVGNIQGDKNRFGQWRISKISRMK